MRLGRCRVKVDYGIVLRYEFSDSVSPATRNQPTKDALAAFPKQSHSAFRCDTDPDSNSFGQLCYEDTSLGSVTLVSALASFDCKMQCNAQ